MTLSELRDLIRVEAEIPGTEIIGTTLDALINQALYAITGKSPFSEMRTEENFTITTDDEHTFTLPEDFQHFDKVIYAPPTTSPSFCSPARTLFVGNSGGLQKRIFGSPTYYLRAGNELIVYPYTGGIYVNDVFVLSYYKFMALVNDDDIFPIISLIPVVTQMVLERIMRTSSTKQSIVAGAGAMKSFQDARSLDAGS